MDYETDTVVPFSMCYVNYILSCSTYVRDSAVLKIAIIIAGRGLGKFRN